MAAAISDDDSGTYNDSNDSKSVGDRPGLD
jgi:hypothetical protein